jgi:hypothetical protein
MKLQPIASTLLLLNCCVAQATNEPEIAPKEVTYCQLAKDPSPFVGRRLRIRAIYRYGFEIQRLESAVCCPERGAKIWVEMGTLEEDSQKLLHKFPKGMGLVLAVFVGTFEGGGPYGDGGYRFRLTVDQIEKIESTARASPGHDPVWVPQNCETTGDNSGRQVLAAPLHEVGPCRAGRAEAGDGTETNWTFPLFREIVPSRINAIFRARS